MKFIDMQGEYLGSYGPYSYLVAKEFENFAGHALTI